MERQIRKKWHMIYKSCQRIYVPVMQVLKGEANDILICRDAILGRNNYYTVLVIHGHETVKRLLRVMERSCRGCQCCVELFWQDDAYCAVFPYVKERYLKSFYMPAQMTAKTRAEICENLVLACMLSKLPYPLLYLALLQEQIHLRADHSVEPGYTVELDELDETVGEGECARQCTAVLRELLAPGKGRESMAYRFFMKKWDYETFDSLYRDLRLVKGTLHRRGRLSEWRLFFKNHQNGLLRGVRILCTGVMILALICLLSRAVWGEIPFLRILVNHFRVIGTQSLAG